MRRDCREWFSEYQARGLVCRRVAFLILSLTAALSATMGIIPERIVGLSPIQFGLTCLCVVEFASGSHQVAGRMTATWFLHLGDRLIEGILEHWSIWPSLLRIVAVGIAIHVVVSTVTQARSVEGQRTMKVPNE